MAGERPEGTPGRGTPGEEQGLQKAGVTGMLPPKPSGWAQQKALLNHPGFN